MSVHTHSCSVPAAWRGQVCPWLAMCPWEWQDYKYSNKTSDGNTLNKKKNVAYFNSQSRPMMCSSVRSPSPENKKKKLHHSKLLLHSDHSLTQPLLSLLWLQIFSSSHYQHSEICRNRVHTTVSLLREVATYTLYGLAQIYDKTDWTLFKTNSVHPLRANNNYKGIVTFYRLRAEIFEQLSGSWC